MTASLPPFFVKGRGSRAEDEGYVYLKCARGSSCCSPCESGEGILDVIFRCGEIVEDGEGGLLREVHVV
jgi:hypothetical protein